MNCVQERSTVFMAVKSDLGPRHPPNMGISLRDIITLCTLCSLTVVLSLLDVHVLMSMWTCCNTG